MLQIAKREHSEASELRRNQAIAEPKPPGIGGSFLGPAQRRRGGRDEAIPEAKSTGVGSLFVGAA